MGEAYGVIPFEVTDDMVRWLHAYRIPTHSTLASGRYPAPSELRVLLQTIPGFAVSFHEEHQQLVSVYVAPHHPGSAAAYSDLVLFDYTDPHLPCSFSFYKGDPFIHMRVVHQLCTGCGPLVFFNHSTVTPALITSSTDIDQEMHAWNERTQAE